MDTESLTPRSIHTLLSKTPVGGPKTADTILSQTLPQPSTFNQVHDNLKPTIQPRVKVRNQGEAKSIIQQIRLTESYLLPLASSQTLSVKKKPSINCHTPVKDTKEDKNPGQKGLKGSLIQRHWRVNTMRTQANTKNSSRDENQPSRYSFKTVRTQNRIRLVIEPPSTNALLRTQKPAHTPPDRVKQKHPFSCLCDSTDDLYLEADQNLKKFLTLKLGLT